MNGKYTLEVSSPGIERKLKTLHHFECSIGSNVKVKDYQKELLKGELISVNSDGLISIKDLDENIHEIQFDDVLSASTYYEWNK